MREEPGKDLRFSKGEYWIAYCEQLTVGTVGPETAPGQSQSRFQSPHRITGVTSISTVVCRNPLLYHVYLLNNLITHRFRYNRTSFSTAVGVTLFTFVCLLHFLPLLMMGAAFLTT